MIHCPKCAGLLETIAVGDVEIDRCGICHGIWFDFAEMEELKDMKASEFIDVGNPQVGREMDGVSKTRCPRCRKRLYTMTDREQPQISYEVCPAYCGCFMDAGEFTDLKDFTLVEQARHWLRRLRKNLK